MTRRLLIPTLLLVLAGCEPDIARPDPNGRALGAIIFYGDTARIIAPAKATAGADIPVSIETAGGACMSKGDTEVRVDDLVAVVSPYDYAPRTEMVCILILVAFRHDAVVRFHRPGLATLVVRGQQQPGNRVLTLTRTILVQ